MQQTIRFDPEGVRNKSELNLQPHRPSRGFTSRALHAGCAKVSAKVNLSFVLLYTKNCKKTLDIPQ